jgi:hypothetical protein
MGWEIYDEDEEQRKTQGYSKEEWEELKRKHEAKMEQFQTSARAKRIRRFLKKQ